MDICMASRKLAVGRKVEGIKGRPPSPLGDSPLIVARGRMHACMPLSWSWMVSLVSCSGRLFQRQVAREQCFLTCTKWQLPFHYHESHGSVICIIVARMAAEQLFLLWVINSLYVIKKYSSSLMCYLKLAYFSMSSFIISHPLRAISDGIYHFYAIVSHPLYATNYNFSSPMCNR